MECLVMWLIVALSVWFFLRSPGASGSDKKICPVCMSYIENDEEVCYACEYPFS
jgi:predicted amidophosphoribosyltransferase